MNNFASGEVCDLPPAMPQVSFDIRSQELFESVDFDYQAFYALAKSYNVSDEAINDYRIILSCNTEYDLGQYFGRRHTSKVYNFGSKIRNTEQTTNHTEIPQEYSSEYVDYFNNKLSKYASGVLAHETGHWVEHIHKGEGYRVVNDRMYMLGGFALSSTGATVALAIERADMYILPVPIVAAVAILTGWLFRYDKVYPNERSDPKEIYAVDFEKKHKDIKLVTVKVKGVPYIVEGKTKKA